MASLTNNSWSGFCFVFCGAGNGTQSLPYTGQEALYPQDTTQPPLYSLKLKAKLVICAYPGVPELQITSKPAAAPALGPRSYPFLLPAAEDREQRNAALQSLRLTDLRSLWPHFDLSLVTCFHCSSS